MRYVIVLVMKQLFSKVNKKKAFKCRCCPRPPPPPLLAKHPPDEKLKERKGKQPLSLCELIGGWWWG
jgi:hypothetical protein